MFFSIVLGKKKALMVHNKEILLLFYLCAFTFLMEPCRNLWLIHICRILGDPDVFMVSQILMRIFIISVVFTLS